MYVYCMVGRTMYAVNVFEIMNIFITSVHFSLPGGRYCIRRLHRKIMVTRNLLFITK